jgi:hypothetical protein
MTLAVKQESGMKVVVQSVVTENERLLALEQVTFFLECDFYLINWTREDFAPHTHIINKKIVKATSDSMKPTRTP